MIKIGLITLGCPKNQVDSEIILGIISEKEEFQIIEDLNKADIIIINTCGFIEDAKEESINTILEAGRLKEEGQLKGLIVTGCLSQRYREEILKELPEVNAIMGTGTFDDINQIVERVLKGERISNVGKPSFQYKSSLPRIISDHFAYIKIAEGCSNNCTYCSIPQIRGPLYSRAIEDVCLEVEKIVAQGVKEIILVAQDTTVYGQDLYGVSALATLLKELLQIKGIEWLRLMYSYPEHLDDNTIELIAREDKICNYLDLPIQHSSNRIRKLMNRKVSRQEIIALIKKIRNRIPEIVIRTSLIVGFPGETEKDFLDLIDFVSEIQFERLGVFKYSREEKTAAANFKNQIPEEVKEERYKILMELQQKIAYNNNQGLIGKKLKVIIDEIENEIAFGRTEYDAPEIDNQVILPANNLKVGDIITCNITEAYEYDLIGERSNEPT
jgi:ribosomal protein S12 methylthiotransferase